MNHFWQLLGILALAASPVAGEDRCLHFLSPTVPAESKDSVVRLLKAETHPDGAGLNPYRGSIVVRLQVNEPFGGAPAYVEMYPGPPWLNVRCAGHWPKDEKGNIVDRTYLECGVTIDLRSGLEVIKSKTIRVKPGGELHAVWTWSGVRHQVFLNGDLVTTYAAKGPLPPKLATPLRILSNGPDLKKAPVREIALYNFTMSPEQVAEDFRATDLKPLRPKVDRGPSMLAQWAPGENRVYVAADSGNPLAAQVTTYHVEARDAAGTVLAACQAPARGGFAEALLDLPPMKAGVYQARVSLRDASDHELANADSEPWDLPEVPWLRNTLGLSEKIQPPWTPIQASGTDLAVWGRQLRLAGGFGLPQQITSQGREWLKTPVSLELERASNAALTGAHVEITEARPNQVRWRGRAEAGDVEVRVEGTLEYDGMILLQLTLAPKAGAGPVNIDAMRLRTLLPKDRALFLNTSTDQGYWWYPYRGGIPAQPGVVHTNLKQKAAKTNFLFFTLFCDHDTGLEWFADNTAGWQIDEKRVAQEIIRQPDGDVELLCHLANRPFTLSAPVTITFGYEATPVKPLPVDWRTLYVNSHKMALASDLALWWLWPNPNYDKFRPNIFSLRPEDLEGYEKATRSGVLRAPFTNQHVLVPSYPDNQRPEKGWTWLNHLLQDETENDGWNSVPTRGLRDYWAWNLDQWIAKGGMDAIYIDEAGYNTVGGSLLSGAGFVRPDGTRGFGHDTLGLREQLKRVRQLFLDHGKRPLVWLPIYGKYLPHVYAFADITSEGEAFTFDKPDAPDWIDQWGSGLLLPPGEVKNGPAGQWLLSIGPTQKFGSIPLFLDYVRFYGRPEYRSALRAQYGLLGLLDMIPINCQLGWYFKAKEDFGVAAPDVTFHPFHQQHEIASGRDDVPISYYRRPGKVLAVVTNLGKTPYDGALRLDLAGLGLQEQTVRATLLDEQTPKPQNTEVRRESLPPTPSQPGPRLAIPPHDFRLIWLE